MHDSSRVLMGATKSSFRIVDNKKGTIPAGKVVRLKSDDTLSIAAADGSLLGVSLGLSLDGTGYTPICREGTEVPILLTAAFTPVIGAQVFIDDVTGIAKTSGAGVTGVNATFASGVLTGMLEDGTEANVAYIDFPGGL